jgi:hypothetical protein
VLHEPCAPRRGPDFFVRFEPLQLSFEVKRPQQSKRLLALQLLTTRIHWGMTGYEAALDGINAWSLEFVISGDVLDAVCGDNG